MSPPSQMNCHSCHQPIRPGSKFCPLCGAAQAETTPCPACRAPVVSGKTFCPHCGASLSDEAEATEAQQRADEDELTRLILPGDETLADRLEQDFSAADRLPQEPEEPEDPVTEMFLESNWQAEGGLADLARQGAADVDPTPPPNGDASAAEPAPEPPPVPAQPTSDEDLERTVILRSGLGKAPDLPPATPSQSEPAANGSPPGADWGVETVRLSAEALQQAREPEPSQPETARRAPLRLAAAATIVVALLAGIVWWLTGADEPTPPAASAQVETHQFVVQHQAQGLQRLLYDPVMVQDQVGQPGQVVPLAGVGKDVGSGHRPGKINQRVIADREKTLQQPVVRLQFNSVGA